MHVDYKYLIKIMHILIGTAVCSRVAHLHMTLAHSKGHDYAHFDWNCSVFSSGTFTFDLGPF